MSKKVLIFGCGGAGKALATLAAIEKFGESVEVYTLDKAQKAGLGPKDFDNLPTDPKLIIKSGKELQEKIKRRINMESRNYNKYLDTNMMYAQTHIPPPKAPQHVRSTKKVHNNSVCTCGSGKKYKKCCKT